jgi:hypothetical protein
MEAKNVSSRELRQAKVLLRREFSLSESSVGQVATGWISRSVLDLPLGEPILAGDLVQVTQGAAPQ